MTPDMELAWAAGLLEGEGTFAIKTGTRSPTIACHMTDKDVLGRLAKIFDGPIYDMKKYAEHHKRSWKWVVLGSQAASVMREIYPHMGERRQERIAAVLDVYDNKIPYVRPESSRAREAALEYLARDDLTLRQAAKKYDVSHESVRRWSGKIKEEGSTVFG